MSLAPAPGRAPKKRSRHHKCAANHENEWGASPRDHDGDGNDSDPPKAIFGARLPAEQKVSLCAHRQNPKQDQVEGEAARADKHGTRSKHLFVTNWRVSY